MSHRWYSAFSDARVWTPSNGAPPHLLTSKILRFIRSAGAVVVRRRRIGTQWTRAIDDAGGQMCGFDRLRLLPGFDPLGDRGDFVEDIGAGTALAVPHARHHEQRERIRGRR